MRPLALALALLSACAPSSRLLLTLPEEGVGTLAFDLEGREASYSLLKGAEWRIVRGPTPGPLFDEVSEPMYTPNGRLVYFARKGRDWHLEIWGENPWPPFRLADDADPRHVRIEFSPDGQSIAVAAREAKGELLMINGRRMGRFERVDDLQWSPARYFAAIVLNDDGYGLFLDNAVEFSQPTYDFLELFFTQSGDPIVHASDGEFSYFGHPDELKKTPYLLIDAWTMTTDGRSLAYVAQKGDGEEKVLVVNGKEKMTFRGRSWMVSFNPRNQEELSMVVVEPDGRRYMMVGDRKLGPFERMGPPEYVPGTGDVYFWIWEKDRGAFVVGDRCTPSFEAIDHIRFSPDGRKISICAREGRQVRRYEFDRSALPKISDREKK